MAANWGGRKAQQLRARALRASNVCGICGQPIDLTVRYPHPDSASLDHKVPRAKGGTNHPSNLQPAHRRCNRAKSDKDQAPVVRRSGTLD